MERFTENVHDSDESELEFHAEERESIKENWELLAAEPRPPEYITADPDVKENLHRTLHAILTAPQGELRNAIQKERRWMEEDAFEKNVKNLNESNPDSLKGGYLASVEELKKAVSEGAISDDAPWLSRLKEKLDIWDILLLG